ncbi:EscU/YscU/HrcU family type III secretion system export apparatus switch protein [Breoghania sp. L-A4]|uniref:EscU/YscU/HrcU family type III secretion system export apparatus switch protein n=1 Tax=Breoghania sp. L-A4 TaxID=2304600 RepID=UPI003204D80E
MSGARDDAGKKRIAVALSYDTKGAPRVTAKGEGFLSDQILKIAAEHGVPIEENPLLAQALAQVALDEEIPRNCTRPSRSSSATSCEARNRRRRKREETGAWWALSSWIPARVMRPCRTRAGMTRRVEARRRGRCRADPAGGIHKCSCDASTLNVIPDRARRRRVERSGTQERLAGGV